MFLFLLEHSCFCMFMLLPTGLLSVMFLLTRSFCFCYVYALPDRLTNTSDVSVMFMFLFQLFLFSFYYISVLGRPVFDISVSAHGLLGSVFFKRGSLASVRCSQRTSMVHHAMGRLRSRSGHGLPPYDLLNLYGVFNFRCLPRHG
jgi:hypothetical protein